MKVMYLLLVVTVLVSCGDIGNDLGREPADTSETVHYTTPDTPDTSKGAHPLDSAGHEGNH